MAELLQDQYNTFLAMSDAWWPDAGVAGEADSVQYHLSARDYERTLTRRNRMEAAGIRVLQFLPRDTKPKWPPYHREIQSALAHGAKSSPPRIIAVPADVSAGRAPQARRTVKL